MAELKCANYLSVVICSKSGVAFSSLLLNCCFLSRKASGL